MDTIEKGEGPGKDISPEDNPEANPETAQSETLKPNPELTPTDISHFEEIFGLDSNYTSPLQPGKSISSETDVVGIHINKPNTYSPLPLAETDEKATKFEEFYQKLSKVDQFRLYLERRKILAKLRPIIGKNAASTLTLLERDTFYRSRIMNEKNPEYLKSFSLNISQTVRDEDTQEFLEKVPDLAKAKHRLASFGEVLDLTGLGKLYNEYEKEYRKELADILNKICSVSDLVFENFLEVYRNPAIYFWLNNKIGGHSSMVHGMLPIVAEFIDGAPETNLDPEVLKKFTDMLELDKHDNSSKKARFWGIKARSIGEILENTDLIIDQHQLIEQFIIERTPESSKNPLPKGIIFELLDRLTKDGYMMKLSLLLKKGFILGKEFEDSIETSSSFSYEKLESSVDTAIEVLGMLERDPDNPRMVFIDKILAANDKTFFTIANAGSIKEILESSEKAEEFFKCVDVVAGYQISPEDRKLILSNIFTDQGMIDLRFDFTNIEYKFRTLDSSRAVNSFDVTDSVDSLPEKDQKFWLLIKDQIGGGTTSDAYMRFIFINQDKYLSSDNLDASVLIDAQDYAESQDQSNPNFAKSTMLNERLAPIELTRVMDELEYFQKMVFKDLLGNDPRKWLDGANITSDGRLRKNFVLDSLMTQLDESIWINTHAIYLLFMKLYNRDLLIDDENSNVLKKLFSETMQTSTDALNLIFKNPEIFKDLIDQKPISAKSALDFVRCILTQMSPNIITATRAIRELGNFPSNTDEENAQSWLSYSILSSFEETSTSHSEKDIEYDQELYDGVKDYIKVNHQITSKMLFDLGAGGKTIIQHHLIGQIMGDENIGPDYGFWERMYNEPDYVRDGVNMRIAKGERDANVLNTYLGELDEAFKIIFGSKNPELQKVAEELKYLVVRAENPLKFVRPVEKIYSRNNLPEFAKKFLVFNQVYLTPDRAGKTLFGKEVEEKYAVISRVLRTAPTRRTRDTIFRDLLKINILSDSPSLKAFFEALSAGEAVLKKFEQDGINSLSEEQALLLSKTLDRLEIIEVSARKSVVNDDHQEDSSVTERISRLRKDFQIKDGDPFLPRLSEMFLKSVGIESFEQATKMMNEAKMNAHIRNTQSESVKAGQLHIKEGDLVKGIWTTTLASILGGGMVARDYLGAKCDSDSTPFDSDFLRFDGDNESYPEAFKKIEYFEKYGEIKILIINNGQFHNSSDEESPDKSYNAGQYELFYSGTVNNFHYGVRTGLPCTEIGGIILNDTFEMDTKIELHKQIISFEVANCGFYIPIFDSTGKLIFTPEDYEKYKVEFETLKTAEQPQNAVRIIEDLKSNPLLKSLFEKDAGVSQGFTIEQHTQTVIEQFDKFFDKDFQANFLTRGEFRLFLALHDIGKSAAIEFMGDKDQQHVFTKEYFSLILRTMNFTPNKVEFLCALVDQDIFGAYIQDQKSLETTIEEIDALSESYSIPRNEVFNLIRTFYVCDAGAYTEQASGKEGLDRLFNYSTDDKKPKAEFSPEIAEKIKLLI